MEQYISKSTLVAEIKRRLKEYKTFPDYQTDSNYMELCEILSFINTLNVLTLDDIKEMENQAFLHGIDVERNKNIFNNNKK